MSHRRSGPFETGSSIRCTADPNLLKGPKRTDAYRLMYSVHDIQERLSHRQVNDSHINNARTRCWTTWNAPANLAA